MKQIDMYWLAFIISVIAMSADIYGAFLCYRIGWMLMFGVNAFVFGFLLCAFVLLCIKGRFRV